MAWKESRNVVCIDYNGVMDQYVGYNDGMEYPPRPGLVAFLDNLVNHGYKIVVLTCVNTEKVWNWIYKYHLDIYISSVTNNKIPSLIYIDDRAINFNGNFSDTLNKVLNFKTHWEDKDHIEGGKIK